MNLPIIISLAALAGVLAFLAWRWRQDAEALRIRYSQIINIDSALAAAKESVEQARREQQSILGAAKESLERTRREQQELVAAGEQRRAQLAEGYAHARAIYDGLKKEISLLEENLEDISFGLYKPHFTFQTADQYKAKLEEIRNQEREMIRAGKAAVCPLGWTVGGSAKEGAKMAKQNTKLLLRAFNGECDAAVANVSWNNVTRMEERIRKSFDAINQLGTVLQVSITTGYLNLKLDELRLRHEYEEKQYQEKEEQRRIREEMREEERAQREIEEAREEAEKEEARYEKALEKARAEAALATGKQLEKLIEQMRSLESRIDQARTDKERAMSRAQLTKSGFVYVISNIGSFGERVCKIGMTRRLEPMERINELGDASVPFPFDLHAMLYSDNAPALEYALHEHLADKRVNLVNPRREFYFDVDLDDVEQLVRKRGLSAQFIKVAEAKQYRESLAARQRTITPAAGDKRAEEFPETLFGETDKDTSAASSG